MSCARSIKRLLNGLRPCTDGGTTLRIRPDCAEHCDRKGFLGNPAAAKCRNAGFGIAHCTLERSLELLDCLFRVGFVPQPRENAREQALSKSVSVASAYSAAGAARMTPPHPLLVLSAMAGCPIACTASRAPIQVEPGLRFACSSWWAQSQPLWLILTGGS